MTPRFLSPSTHYQVRPHSHCLLSIQFHITASGLQRMQDSSFSRFFLGLGIWTLPMIQGVNISSFSFFPQRLCSPVSCHVRRPVWGNVDCSITPDSFSLFPPPFLNGIRVFFTVNTLDRIHPTTTKKVDFNKKKLMSH